MLTRHTSVMLAALVIGLVFMADFLSKTWVLSLQEQAVRFPMPLFNGPLFAGLDITIVWNHGISYGFFQAHDGVMSTLIVAVMLVAILAVGAWLVQTKDKIMVLCLSLIIGGALGNLYDRLTYGAVLDFIDVHSGAWHWYVFNLADSAIVIAALGIVLRGMAKPNADLPDV